MQNNFPAPWNLTGRGLIVLFKGNQMATLGDSCVPRHVKGNLKSPLRVLMLVDYASSDAGPYQELLFMPGSIELLGKRRFTISNIFVSSMASVINGRANWGIPKNLADFEWETRPVGSQRVCVRSEGHPVFEMDWQGLGFRFPVSTRIAPKPFKTLVQQWEGQCFTYSPSAAGRARYARVGEIKSRSGLFPALERAEVLTAFEIADFQMTFPIPDIEAL